MKIKLNKIFALLVAVILITTVPCFEAFADTNTVLINSSDNQLINEEAESTPETEDQQNIDISAEDIVTDEEEVSSSEPATEPSNTEQETTKPTTEKPTTTKPITTKPTTTKPTTTKPTTTEKPIKSITFASGDTYNIGLKETEPIYVKDQDGKTLKSGLTYSSSNKSIAVIDSKGNITGKKVGTATITAKTKNGKKATCKVNVKSAATGIKLNITSANIGIDEKSVDLNSTLTGGYSRLRKWTSSNTKVATVDNQGVVTGIKEGTAVITCATFNNKKATCKITVGKKPTSIKITNSNNIIQKGTNSHKTTYKLSSQAYSYKITYSIKDKNIATVDSKGYITGKKCGKTTLTIKTYNGVTAKQTITVNDDSLSLNINSTQLALDNKNVEKVKYGKSVQNRNLEAFIITNPANNGKSQKTLFIDFAIHGFEDEYYRDGQVLVKEANALISYFASHTSELKNYRLVIVPCANPDGTIAGTNNQRACSTAFGRCTAKHVDMNRDWNDFKAVETRNLRDFILKMKPNVYLNMHGWLNETIGDKTLNTIINKQLGLKDRIDRYPSQSGYAVEWVHNKLNIPATLVEYKSSKTVSTTKDVNMIKAIINANLNSSPSTQQFPTAVTWKNGSTTEPVYKVNNLTEKIDTLAARKSAKCYRKSGNSYVIVYDYGSGKHKAGFVKYAGGVKNAPTISKTYINHSTSEKVYADTSKKTSVGSLDPKEKCYCLAKIDGMYLVVYNVNGTSKQKCGFVSYNGGC